MDESAQKCPNIGPDLVLFSSFMHSYLVSLQFSRASNLFPHVTRFQMLQALHWYSMKLLLSANYLSQILQT